MMQSPNTKELHALPHQRFIYTSDLGLANLLSNAISIEDFLPFQNRDINKYLQLAQLWKYHLKSCLFRQNVVKMLMSTLLGTLTLTPWAARNTQGAKVSTVRLRGITTLSIMTLSIMTLSITTLSITTLSITTLSITTFNIAMKIRCSVIITMNAECCMLVVAFLLLC